MFYLKNIESERIRFRPLTQDDVKLWIEFTKDAISTKYFVNLTGTPEEKAEFWISKQLKRYQDKEFGLCGLVLKETGEFIGQAGLLKKKVDGFDEVEVGYSLLRKHTGNGYALEAAKHLKEYALKNNLAETIISIIHVDNIPSQQVARKNGMKEDRQTVVDDTEVIIFRTDVQTIS